VCPYAEGLQTARQERRVLKGGRGSDNVEGKDP